VVDRRRFLLVAASSAVALGAASTLAPSAAAATDDELAFANFGAATELLLKDFYARVGEAELFEGQLGKSFARGERAAGEHVQSLSALMTGAGQTAPLEEDFEFVWPDGTFESKKSASTAALTIVGALLGAYLSGAATSTTSSFRVLYSSLAASLGEQHSLLLSASGHPAIGPSFPAALDLEAASAAVESYLG
jgi:hypothetical protein